MQPVIILKISLLLGCLFLGCVTSELLHPKSFNQKSHEKSLTQKLKVRDEFLNELQDDRFLVVEPYKSLIQVTTRQFLVHSNISRIIDVDLAMSMINEAGYMLAKPAVLLTTLEVVLATAGMVVGATFLIPGANKHLEHFWRNPTVILQVNKIYPNGIDEKSVQKWLNTFENEVLARLGLREESCRRQVLCQMGEICKSKFPRFPESATKFISSLNLGLNDNQYVRAFQAGYVEQDCSFINKEAAKHPCLVDSVKNMLAHVREIIAEFGKLSQRKR